LNLWQNVKILMAGDLGKAAGGPDLIMGFTGIGEGQPKDYLAYEQTYGSEVWVYACASKRAESLASIPLRFYRQGKEVDAPPALATPNPEMTLADLIESWGLFMALTGNAYWELAIAGRGIGGLYPLRTDRMKVLAGNRTPAGYEHNVNGKVQRYAAEEICHSKYEHPFNDWYGISPIEASALAVDSSENIRRYGKNFFKNSARPDYIMEAEGNPKPDALRRIKAAIRKQHGGVSRAHNPMILTGGLKYREVALSPKDAEFLAQAKLNREEICAAMKTPPALVGIFEYANYANAEAQEKMFWGGVVTSDARKLQAVFNRFILPRMATGVTCAFDLSGVAALQSDPKSVWETRKIQLDTGSRTVNELRAEDGLDPVAWGDEPYSAAPAFPQLPPAKGKAEPCECEAHAQTESPARSLKSRIMVKRTQAARDRVLGPIAADIHAAMTKVFTGQQTRALKRLAELVGKSIKLTASELLDEMAEQDLTHTAVYEQLKAAVLAGAINGGNLVGVDMEWDLTNPYVIEAAKGIGEKLAEQVTATTLENLREQVGKGIAEGEGYQDLKKRVESVFDQAKGYRAEMIARTESANAWGSGQLESYKVNEVEKVEWLFGAGPCSSGVCEEADGEIVALGENFPSVGVSSEPAHPNCSCTVIPVID